MWAIHSGCSGQMSDCEQIAQVAHDKWANVSDLLRSLRTNEQMSKKLSFFKQIAHFLFCSQKMSDSLKKIRKNRFFYVFTVFFEVFKKSKRFSHSFWANVSDLLRSLRRNERSWAIRSGCSPKKWANEQIAHFLSQSLICSIFLPKNEWFAPKFDERIPNPELFTSRWTYVAYSPFLSAKLFTVVWKVGKSNE